MSPNRKDFPELVRIELVLLSKAMSYEQLPFEAALQAAERAELDALGPEVCACMGTDFVCTECRGHVPSEPVYAPIKASWDEGEF
jgi:hypothetical protein